MDFIDTSTLSLSIGAIVCIVVILLAKYGLESRNKNLAPEEALDYTTIWVYAIAAGIGSGVIALVLYKQFLVYRSNHDLLTDNFYN